MEGNWKFKLAKFIAADKKELNKATLENIENFTGTHSLNDLTGKILEIQAFEDGEVVSEFSQDFLSKIHLKYAPPIGPSECAGCGWVLMRTYRIKDWYHTGTDSNGNFYFNYTHSSYEGSTSEWVYVYNSGGYNEGYGDYAGGDSYHEHYNNPPHGPAINKNPHDYERLEEEDKINTDNLNNDCVEGIIEKLQVKDSQLSVIPDLGTEVSHLSQIILDLFKTSNEYHLNFKIGDATNANGHARNAYTSPSSNRLGEFTFTITLDQGYIENARQLAIARTIIHESLHAYLGYLYQDDPTTTFMQILNRYRTEKSKLGEHEFMTQFTEAIGASLASWDNHSLDHILNYYEALGWSGDMLKTTAFDKLDEDFQELIKEANKAEGDAINKATTNAKGEKCP